MSSKLEMPDRTATYQPPNTELVGVEDIMIPGATIPEECTQLLLLTPGIVDDDFPRILKSDDMDLVHKTFLQAVKSQWKLRWQGVDEHGEGSPSEGDRGEPPIQERRGSVIRAMNTQANTHSEPHSAPNGDDKSNRWSPEDLWVIIASKIVVENPRLTTLDNDGQLSYFGNDQYNILHLAASVEILLWSENGDMMVHKALSGGQDLGHQDMSKFSNWLKASERTFDQGTEVALNQWLLFVRLPRIRRGSVNENKRSEGSDVDKLLARLFSLLETCGVKKVWRLVVEDDFENPTSDILIVTFLKRLHVEILDWKKPDLDIDQLLLTKELRESIQDIHLYSGNVPSLLYWCGDEGLFRFPRDQYHTRSLIGGLERAELRFQLTLRTMNRRIRLLISHLDLWKLSKPNVLRMQDNSTGSRFFEALRECQEALIRIQGTRSSPDDLVIKVAIVDNGVDPWQPDIAAKVKGGFCAVEGSWSTPEHAHGTMMASLVKRVNPLVHIYAYRVASKTKEPALIFGATSEEPYFYKSVWPADYASHVISVSAASESGRNRVETRTRFDLLLLGENMPAAGLSENGDMDEAVSEEEPGQWREFKRKDKIMEVFKSMSHLTGNGERCNACDY
ncbi:hypothetical protein FOXG_14873 [Fusarium oxysporum f. sp. lycopersici 4287]|uniref:Peptidase S8/S53 domain-containing protein n=2 Tax=Fusarium oxysporum TaxID=5507 RepID=A0A0J9W1B3_FUSO4|nr:hypothetical protein FOXG_14873 [Fusarium oxysporum f. sp. lycopersici 4287]KAJ9412545.1 hypothetical protein QL093DRAFT_2027254 [Fusarium oxysporum]KNB16828.1 hypothetical protein FOXG_14873 [Fusarium oxysporum f. sp. lycopersici 4287]